MQQLIIRIVDTFYFLFKPFMPLKTYRYAACGGGNLVLDTVLYFVFYHYVFFKQDVDLGLFVMKAHIASLFFVFPITFTTGFLLNRFVTFQESDLPWSLQFKRYFIVSMGAIFISYILMKFFVELLGFYATPSKILTLIISVIYSYIFQSKFSFGQTK